MKFDHLVSELGTSERLEWLAHLGMEQGWQLVVAGSTHDPEEKLILNAMREVWRRDSKVKLVLAPRHPERFDEVARLLESEGMVFDRWSLGKSSGAKVLLLDAMGILRSCYQMAE